MTSVILALYIPLKVAVTVAGVALFGGGVSAGWVVRGVRERTL